ncbi:MAG: sugar ABC transporter substrate-binding protein [Nocardiopsaceae bacterium]|nr:sugar ABC transporter substrate-binding protein [Nocardiopsaceae bacterium]
MRIRTAATLLAAGVVTLTAACGAVNVGGSGSTVGAVPANPAKVSGTVTMWIYPIDPTREQADWAPRVAAFERKYPHVKVNVVVQPWANRDEQLQTAIAGGKAPDVVYMIPDQIPGYASNGSLADVSSLVASDKSDFRPDALKALSYGGKLYGVPLLTQVTTLLANKKAMKAAGISRAPKTWGDLLADAPKLKRAGYYATEYDADPTQTLNETFYPLLWQAGGQVLTPDGTKAAFDSAAGVAALTFLTKLVNGGYVPRDSLTTPPQPDTDPIEQGKVGFVMAGDVAALIPTKAMPLSGWAVYPPLSAGSAGSAGPGAKPVSYGTVGGLSILSGSKDKTAAAAWVNWVTSTGQMKSYDKSHHYFPARSSAGTLFPRSTLEGKEERLLPDMTIGSIGLKSRQLMGVISPHIQAALLGQATPRQALSAAASAADNLLSRG